MENETPQRSVPRLSPSYSDLLSRLPLATLPIFVLGGGVFGAIWATSPVAPIAPPLVGEIFKTMRLFPLIFSTTPKLLKTYKLK